MSSKLDRLMQDFNKQYKETITTRGIPELKNERLEFSSPRINYMLYGGLPRGRIIEFSGEEGSGKTTTALDIVANAQELFVREWEKEIKDLEAIEKRKRDEETRLSYLKGRGPHQVVYADCENTLDDEWARLLGVDTDNLILIKPMSQSAEQIFEIILQMIETDEVGLVVIDSLGVMLSQQAYDKSMEEKTYGGIAMALTLFSKKAELLCTRYNCTIIGINQVRANLNSPYGGLVTTGGKAWKHNCSVRLLFRQGNYLDAKGNQLKRSAGEPEGVEVLVHIEKTKICKPDRRLGFYTLMFHKGIDVIADTIETAVMFGIIRQAGSWFNFVDIETGEILSDGEGEPIKIQGKANLKEYLEENKEMTQRINQQIRELIEKS